MYSWIKKSIGEIYYVLPYIEVVKNKFQFIASLVFHKKQLKIELTNGVTVIFKREQFNTLIALLGAASFATSCEKKSNNVIELSFDMKNKFVIDLNEMSIENEKLLQLLYEGTLHGASFIVDTNDKFMINEKTIRISKN